MVKKNSIKCFELIDKYCILDKSPIDENYIEIFIYTKNDKKKIAHMVGFLYNYKFEYAYGEKNSAFHIKTLWTHKGYLKRGIATYLMKEGIKYAEYNKVKHITVHPCACTHIISQEELERFYKKFLFDYKYIGFKRERGIEFKNILD